MFERFTERARQVVVLAQEEAKSNKANYIGCEHLLVGLMREEGGLAARILASLDVTLDKTREGIQARFSGSGEGKEGQIPFTPRCQKTLELALREALGLGHNYIGTEHLLLGLLREGDNVALEILRDDFSTSVDTVRNEVIRMLSGPKAPQVSSDKRERSPSKSPTIETVKVDDLIALAVTLGRQHPEVPVTKVIAAARHLI